MADLEKKLKQVVSGEREPKRIKRSIYVRDGLLDELARQCKDHGKDMYEVLEPAIESAIEILKKLGR